MPLDPSLFAMPTSTIERTYPNLLPFSLLVRSITVYSVEIVYPRLPEGPLSFSFKLIHFIKRSARKCFYAPAQPPLYTAAGDGFYTR